MPSGCFGEAQASSLERMAASLSSLFGLMALMLAAIGLYGVVVYTVARRTHEIGIRVGTASLCSLIPN